MNSREDALAYYRLQCDELGARVLRLQEELTQVRRDAQRNRTLALVIQQLHDFEHAVTLSDGFAEELADRLLMLMVERFQVGVAALLRWYPQQGAFRVEHGLGVASGVTVPAIPSTAASAPSPPEDLPRHLGVEAGLWVATPRLDRLLLLGHRHRSLGGHEPVGEGDRVVAEVALKVYEGLLERQAALHALRDSEATYRALFEGAQDAILVLDLRGVHLLEVNRTALVLFGGTLAELHQHPPSSRLVPADPQRWKPLWKAVLRGVPQRLETQIRTASERLLWTEITLKRVETHEPVLLAVVRDISARKRAEEALQRLQERLELALEGAEVGLYDVNLETGAVVYDDRFVRILGGDPEWVPKTVADWWGWIHPEDVSTVQRVTNEVLSGQRERVELEYRFRHQSGGWVWLLDRGKGFEPDSAGHPRRAAGTCVDITARKISEASINRLAYYDPLTDLPNRRLFIDRLANAQAAARRDGHLGAVLFLDLDRFKQINDARGHEAGDHLLQEVAARLRALLRANDTVARFGGDEFVILIGELARLETEAQRFAHSLAEKVRQALAIPFRLAEGEVSSGASIGISLFRGPESSIHDILREADTALYRAKESGRNCVRFFEPSMQEAAEARFNLEEELRQALARDELELHYQVQLDAQGAAVGAEALLRWRHPVKGMISPGLFVPLAEESSLILAIGHWVLAEACQFLARLARAGRALRMSVNVSPRQFREAGFVEQVRQVLIDAAIPPGRLILEITEGVVIDDLLGTIARLEALKALGVLISIDDFGTGYSSLTYLKRLPIDELKIDRSFVQDVCTDAHDAALVEAILTVCRHLRVRVVAEGVETPEQAQLLRALGCEGYQGYLFGRPLLAEPFVQALATHPMRG